MPQRSLASVRSDDGWIRNSAILNTKFGPPRLVEPAGVAGRTAKTRRTGRRRRLGPGVLAPRLRDLRVRPEPSGAHAPGREPDGGRSRSGTGPARRGLPLG